MTKEYPRYPVPLSDLIDRLSIDFLKAIFITDHRKEYWEEIEDILRDINHLCKMKELKLDAKFIRAIIVIALTNREIWLNESKARKGGSEQDKLLRFTHSLNGQRNTAKNMIANKIGDREDLKIDCLAEDFKAENFIKNHGNWDLFRE